MARHPKPAEFNRNNDFVVGKRLLVSSRLFETGQPFDKTLVSTRRLRQLYDAKYLQMLPRQPKPPEPPEPEPVVIPESLPEERTALQQLYADVTGEPPNSRWAAKTLQAKLEKLRDGESS